MTKIDPYGCWDGAVDDGVAGDEELENMLSSILDFPVESLEGDGLFCDWDTSKSQHLGPIPMDILLGPPRQTRIDTGPPVFMHTPIALNKSVQVQETGTFRSHSPVSVLENSNSSLAGKGLVLKSGVAKRTRSKRARPSGVNPWLLFPPLRPTDAKKTKEKRKKLPNPHKASDYAKAANAAAAEQRLTKKCAHCEITKTPQWREGPLGPKTLCNACGVRYRSGRLFPEYRPVASPTFVPSLHSNSHKKVIEMRNRGS